MFEWNSDTISFSAKDLYKNFMERVVAGQKLYGLYDDGWAICVNPSGKWALAVWHSADMAGLLIENDWQRYTVTEISLTTFIEEQIPFLKENKTLVSIDMNPEGQNILISPDRFLMDLKKYLYQLHFQQPDVYKVLNLPSPRDIRISR